MIRPLRFGMQQMVQNNIHLKATRLRSILCALTIRRMFSLSFQRH
nr:hypothetical protein Iba_chr03aCG1400 [Ipomoea batatas]